MDKVDIGLLCTIGGFIVGAIIIVILILVIGNMAGVFHFGGSSAKSNSTAATSTSTSAESSSSSSNSQLTVLTPSSTYVLGNQNV